MTRKPKIFYGYVVVAASLLIMAAVYGVEFSFGVFIEPMLAEFGWGSAVVSGAFSVALLLGGLLSIPAGRFSDRFGPKKVVMFCNLFFGLGLVLMSQVNAVWQLYLFYGVLVGIGISAGIAPLESTVVKWFVKRRGLMVAIFLMGMTGGQAIVPPIADWLIQLSGWRTTFIILGGVGFSVILLAALLLKRSPVQIGELPYGIDDVENYGSEYPLPGLALREAFHTVRFWLLCVYFFCVAFAMMTIMTHIVPHAIISLVIVGWQFSVVTFAICYYLWSSLE